jgi:hypothetical protein
MPARDPLLLSRIVTLLASLAVSLVSGTNYAVGAWAPDVKAQLGLSSTAVGPSPCRLDRQQQARARLTQTHHLTQINLVGVSGNREPHLARRWSILIAY